MGGENCVLVVDDDSGIRMLVGRALEHAGYRVMNASDGAHALEILATRTIDIDLVVTDIAMPRLGGLELGRRVAGMTPPIPVLYMSAELPDALVESTAHCTLPPFLLKPFPMRALVAVVMGLLATSNAYQGEHLA